MRLPWFRSPTETDPGTTNLAYAALDHRVILGQAEADAVQRPGAGGVVSVARLLEDVAALAGAMRGLSVVPGDKIGIDLQDPFAELLALVATLRLGAVAHDGRVWPARLWLTDSSLTGASDQQLPEASIVRGVEPHDRQRELDWELAMQLGRTDPAPVADVAGDSPAYVWGGRAVLVREILDADDAWGRLVAGLVADKVVTLGERSPHANQP